MWRSDIEIKGFINIDSSIARRGPNPEGFVYISWKKRQGGGIEGRIQ